MTASDNKSENEDDTVNCPLDWTYSVPNFVLNFLYVLPD